MSLLSKVGIIARSNETADIFERLFPNFFAISYSTPADYVQHNWDKYLGSGYTSNARNGRIFEYLLATLFIREELYPLYLSAKVAFVPNVVYDMLFYSTRRGPICVSAKTSLRERYKQADLEAIALKYVHRRALCFLVTLNEAEAASVQEKIRRSEVIGIDEVVVATMPQINEFIVRLRQEEFIEAPSVQVIESGLKVTASKVIAAQKGSQV